MATHHRWRVESSPSGRAGCKACHERIGKGQVRWADVQERTNIHGALYSYYHLDCLPFPKEKDLRFSLNDVEGLNELDDKQTQEVKKALDKAKDRAGAPRAKRAAPHHATFHEPPKKILKAGREIDYGALLLAELKDILRLNRQLLKGTKDDLVRRCEEMSRNGRFLACPACLHGQLALVNDGSDSDKVKCFGYWDEEIEMRESCDFVADPSDERIKRAAWLLPGRDDPADAGDPAEEERLLAEAVAAAKRAAGGGAPAAEIVLGAAERLNVAMEYASAGPRNAADRALEAASGDVRMALKSLRTQFGLAGVRADSLAAHAASSGPCAAYETNARIADALDELAHLEAHAAHEHANFMFRVRADHRAASAIRMAPFEISSGAQISKGKHKLPGVGARTANRVDEFLKTGSIARSAELKGELENANAEAAPPKPLESTEPVVKAEPGSA